MSGSGKDRNIAKTLSSNWVIKMLNKKMMVIQENDNSFSEKKSLKGAAYD